MPPFSRISAWAARHLGWTDITVVILPDGETEKAELMARWLEIAKAKGDQSGQVGPNEGPSKRN